MAVKVKGLALMGAVALHLASAPAQAADKSTQEAAPPATAPHSVLQLTEADFKRLAELGITTNQAEIDAELAEVQATPEVYGPLDTRGLQRTIDRDMQQTLGDDYAHTPEAYKAYMAELRERYEGAGNSNRVRIVLAQTPEQNASLRVKRIGIEYTQSF